jgi:single-stranded-DNA-specific exonuclease
VPAEPAALPQIPAQSSALGRVWRQRGDGVAAFERPGLPEVIARLLSARGIRDAATADAFLSGALERGHDPFLLPQMEQAVERIIRALRGGELIAVFGDYDVDGVTATAILVEGLTGLGGNVIPYLPNRFIEGYGVNRAALSELHARGATLVITADCGINAVEEVDFANELGLEVIVADHHSIPPRLPAAVALIDPKLEGCTYPTTELAACGIAHKLVQAVAERLGAAYDHRTHLDLVALGTVCDMAPLVGENRWFVRHGLKALARTQRPGLRALAQLSGSDLARADAETLGFRLGPRLNAAGRLADARLAYELITTPDERRARELASRLNVLNTERQRRTVEAVTLAQQLVENHHAEAPLLVVGHATISQGIVGLVAARLAELFGRPAFVYEEGPELSRGSARGTRDFDVVAALQAASDLLVRFGGHRAAGGFTVESARIPALRAFLEELAAEQRAAADEPLVVEYDDDLDLDAFGPAESRWLRYLEPFGQANPEPLFRVRGLRVESCKRVGADGRHLVLGLRTPARVWRGIAFGLADAAPAPGSTIDALLAYRLDDRGRPDLHVKDFAPAAP